MHPSSRNSPYNRLVPRVIDFNVLLQQLRMIRHMGNVRRIVHLIPGLSLALPKEAIPEMADVRRCEAIILAMTKIERSNPDLLDGSRRARIARGSGTTTAEVGDLVHKIYRMRRFHGA